MTLETRPLTEQVGLEVLGADLQRLSDPQMAELAGCLDRTGALLIRGQALAPEELVAFSRRFGELDEAPVNEAGKTVVAGLPAPSPTKVLAEPVVWRKSTPFREMSPVASSTTEA